MKIFQKSYIEVEKDGKLVQLVVPSDLSLGLIFDALMELKGYVCERMVSAHKEEAEEAERQMGVEESIPVPGDE
jgi:hypothetical protein